MIPPPLSSLSSLLPFFPASCHLSPVLLSSPVLSSSLSSPRLASPRLASPASSRLCASQVLARVGRGGRGGGRERGAAREAPCRLQTRQPSRTLRLVAPYPAQYNACRSTLPRPVQTHAVPQP
eukprot:2683007-Rhodomonas_salina.2